MTMRTGCEPRRAPFLQRNWVKGITALQDSAAMGNIVSSPGKRGSSRDHSDRNGASLLKRRRISTPEPFEIDDVALRHGLDHSPSSSPSLSPSTMRIEILKIFHKSSKKTGLTQNGSAPPPRDIISIKANCRVAVLDHSSGRPRVLHCQSQLCDLKVIQDSIGFQRIAGVDLPQPFFVSEESILINRPEDGKFGLSSAYEILVELEAAHDAQWPPLNAADLGVDPATVGVLLTRERHWILSSRFDRIFGKINSPLAVSPGYPSKKHARQTDYAVGVDLRWSSGLKTSKRPEKNSKHLGNTTQPSNGLPQEGVRAPSPSGNVRNTSSSLDQQAADDAPLEVEEEQEGAQTPSRSLRARENKVYNLKILSDQAQGRDRRHRSGDDAPALPSEGQVTYLLPSDQPVCLDFFRCVTCGAFHRSIMQLQLHLKSVHPGFDYSFETTSQGPQFRVRSRSESLSSASKTYDLRRPAQPFNIQSLIAGDQSWITSRLDPKNVDNVFENQQQQSQQQRPDQTAPLPISPFPLQPPPPAADDTASRPQTPRQQHAMQRRSGAKGKAKVLVPDIPQPLFDPVSRVRLAPGQEVPKSTTDCAWLIQKHRESIADFSDVTPSEKEYIWEWDEFIFHQGLTSAAYFPRAWLDFVRQKADWLVGAENRMLEFGKHMSTLMIRDLIDDDHVRKAFSHINAARAGAKAAAEVAAQGGAADVDKTKAAATTRSSPRSPQIRKGANGCAVCQLPVLGPRMLICANKRCSRRLYHSDCVGQKTLSARDKRKWLCSACLEVELPA